MRLFVDHTAGKHGRGAVLADETGRRALGLNGAWAVTDDGGRTLLFLAPDFAAVAKASVVDGLISGALGVDSSSPARLRNAGPGHQTVKRPKVPVRGLTGRWTPVATVDRERTESGEYRYLVEPHEEALPPATFAHLVDPAGLAGDANGFADPAQGVWDLVHPDGRGILRHWAAIDKERHLVRSTFDVEDDEYPLAEAVMLCLARFACWRD